MAIDLIGRFKEIIILFIRLLQLAIVIRSILTWFPYNKNIKPIFDFLTKLTEPVLLFVYKITNNKLVVNNADFTPVLAYFILSFISRFILVLL